MDTETFRCDGVGIKTGYTEDVHLIFHFINSKSVCLRSKKLNRTADSFLHDGPNGFHRILRESNRSR